MYYDYILSADEDLVREIQAYCANIHEAHGKAEGRAWTTAQAEHVAGVLNRSENPGRLFRFIDERTGSRYVGYKTRDGREWFHILRQMRNTKDSGLLENLRYS